MMDEPTYTHKQFGHPNQDVAVLNIHEILQCDVCGALVTDSRQHDDWHGDVRRQTDPRLSPSHREPNDPLRRGWY
jgi:hypothetical protein